MYRKFSLFIIITLMLLSIGAIGATAQDMLPQGPASPVGTTITYQGHLTDNNNPANGEYDIRFILYDSEVGGSQVGSTKNMENVLVSDGYFTVQLDFGPGIFENSAIWLEVAVRPGASTGSYTILSPRQALTPTPFAVYASNAGALPWSGLSGVPAGFADGVDNDTTYKAGTGLTLSSEQFSLVASFRLPQDCLTNQIPKWDGSSWICSADDNTTYTAGPGLTLNVNQFSADLAGSGSASTIARSDHNHLGQTWTGNNNPLVIDGSFAGSSPNNAALVLSNSNAGASALSVASSAGAGVSLSSVAGEGFQVGASGKDGFRAGKVGTTYCSSGYGTNNGVELGCVEDNGVLISWVGAQGVRVLNTGDDGFYVFKAGNSAGYNESTGINGFEVAGAVNYGLYIGWAGTDGIEIAYAYDDGIQIGDGTNTAKDGLYTATPGVLNTALLVYTQNINHEWALYTPDKISAANVLAGSLSMIAKVDSAGILNAGDLVAVSGMEDSSAVNNSPLPLVRLADGQTWSGVIGVVESRMEFKPASGKESDSALELHSTAGTANPNDYVAIKIYGIAQVKVDTSVGKIYPGVRLTASDLAGSARPLRTETLNGMVVSEGAQVIGIALTSPTSGSNTIPVFITLH